MTFKWSICDIYGSGIFNVDTSFLLNRFSISVSHFEDPRIKSLCWELVIIIVWFVLEKMRGKEHDELERSRWEAHASEPWVEQGHYKECRVCSDKFYLICHEGRPRWTSIIRKYVGKLAARKCHSKALSRNQTCGSGGDNSRWMLPPSSTWAPSDFGGKTKHTLPAPSHPSNSNIFQRNPNWGCAPSDKPLLPSWKKISEMPYFLLVYFWRL